MLSRTACGIMLALRDDCLWVCVVDRIAAKRQQFQEQMKSDQQWQVSMVGSETKYSMLKQLFDTAAEIVQGKM